jgi:hypothetical protein
MAGKKRDMLHPFSRIMVINNLNYILHNQSDWVIHNQYKRVPNLAPFFPMAPLFYFNIPSQSPNIIIKLLIIYNPDIFVIINNHDPVLIIYNSIFIIYNKGSNVNNHVLQFESFIKSI